MYGNLKCSEPAVAFPGLRAGMVLVLILLSALAAPAAAQTDPTERGGVDAGPYVQFKGPFAAVVRWDTHEPCDSIVEYGTTRSLGLRVENPSAAAAHELTLSNLQYRTMYYYRVGSGDGATEHFSDIYTFDNSINYTRLDCSAVASPYPVDSLSSL